MLKTPKGLPFSPVSADVELVGKRVLDPAFKVHTILGPELLKSVYEACLAYEIRKSGFQVETQVALPVLYEGVRVDAGLRMDMLIEKYVIVELKSVVTSCPSWP